MPVYEQRCTACGHEFEVQRSVADREPVECPKCRCITQRLISLSSFRLKGDSWSGTGYAGKPPKKEPGA
jgi:putative FmdB family regulatory protein